MFFGFQNPSIELKFLSTSRPQKRRRLHAQISKTIALLSSLPPTPIPLALLYVQQNDAFNYSQAHDISLNDAVWHPHLRSKTLSYTIGLSCPIPRPITLLISSKLSRRRVLMALPVVDTDYLKEIDKARRDLRALIASKNCAPIMLRLA